MNPNELPHSTKRGNQGTGGFSNLPKVTQLLSVGVRNPTLAVWLPFGCILKSQVLGYREESGPEFWAG